LCTEGIKLYGENKFELAKKQLELALIGLVEKNPEECAKCYLLIISCCIKLKNNEEAINACEKALMVVKQEDSEAILESYHSLLADIKPSLLYSQAMEAMNPEQPTKNPLIASIKMEFVLGKLATKDKNAACHSNLASCYRELNNIPKAIEHCKIALTMREGFKPRDEDLIGKTKFKLDQLEKMVPTNTPSVSLTT